MTESSYLRRSLMKYVQIKIDGDTGERHLQSSSGSVSTDINTNDDDRHEFVAFLLWYMFLVLLCCVLPACCMYRYHRRRRRMSETEEMASNSDLQQ